MKQNYFLNMVQHLRQHEEVMLFNNILEINESDAAETVAYLQEQYRKESLEYPHSAPAFDAAAALWAAKTMNMAAQLLLYRENKPENLDCLFPAFDRETDNGAVLSADLCLRFLPDTLRELKIIDSLDPLILILENMLAQWHYSGIHYPLDLSKTNLENGLADPCMRQLYIDRIIHYKNISLAQHALFRKHIGAALGLYAPNYWKEFQTEKQIHDIP
jgi:hypothetical protein